MGGDPLDVCGRLKLEERCHIIDGVVCHVGVGWLKNKLGMQLSHVNSYLTIFMSLG